MPTNEERREVARRLRKNDPSIFATVFDVFREIGLAVNPQGHTFKVLPLQLADLIEPEPERTCHNLSEFQDCDCFTCSNCGESYEMRRLEYDIDEYCTLDDAIKALDYDGCYCDVRYCPNCGARVVEE